MNGVSKPTKMLKSRWRYHRIATEPWYQQGSVPRRKSPTIQFTDPNKPKKSKRSWRLKLIPKIRFRLVSPKSMLKKIRDAYINMMVGFSRSRKNSVGLIMGHHMVSSVASRNLPLRNSEMSNKALQRMYTAYLQKAVAEGKLVVTEEGTLALAESQTSINNNNNNNSNNNQNLLD